MTIGDGVGALVTGGAQRLGKAMAIALANQGIHVAVHYQQSSDLVFETVDELCDLGVIATAVKADFMDESQTEELIDKACTNLGCQLNVLINNAAIFERDHITSAERKLWEAHIAINVRAPFVLTQKFAHHVQLNDKDTDEKLCSSACIINMVDQRVMRPTSEFATYTISKMALWDLTQISAVALAPRVRVNAIAPGPTLIAKGQSQEHFERQRRTTPLKRGASENEVVAAMELFINSPSITGQIICIDGGRNMIWRSG